MSCCTIGINLVQCIHIISRYRTIEFDQKFGNNANAPHVADSKLFILWRHKDSWRRVLVVVVVIIVLS